MPQMTMVQSLNLALREMMREDENILIMGEDVGRDGGVFRVTDGLIDEFGEDRVIDTPLAEAAIGGTAIGLCFTGFRPVIEFQFDGFSFQAYHHVEGHVRRFRNRTRSRYTVPMVIRMPYGGGIRALEHHSEAPEALYAHLVGLKVVIPSGPRHARALLRSALKSPDPIVFFEPKALYRAFREDVPEQPEEMPLGKGVVAREGTDVTLISYGATLRTALEAAEELEDEYDLQAEVLDLISLSPIDNELISKSVEKTGRAVVIHEAPRHCGVGAEVVSRIVEESLMYLEAPVKRVTGFDTVIPFFANEKTYLPDVGRIVKGTLETVNF